MDVQRAPNLAAIAAEARVSRMTVSRALRNVRSVTPETRRRVLSVAEKLGYRPNPLVSAFMSFVRTSRVREDVDALAYVTTGVTRHSWRTTEAYVRFFNGALARAEQGGYKLEEFWLNERGVGASRLSQILYTRGIRGVLLGPMVSPHGHLNLDWDKFSAAAIGYSLLKPTLHRATNDQHGSMFLALRELRRLGYRRIGLALPYNNDARVYYHWSSAFLSYHARYFRSHRPLCFLPKTWSYDALLAWIHRAEPDALVTTDACIYKTVLDAGFKMPKELGMALLDWSPRFRPCSGVDQQPEEVGGAAVDLVVDQINRNEFGIPLHPRTVLLAGAWVDGSARTAPPGAPARKRTALAPI